MGVRTASVDSTPLDVEDDGARSVEDRERAGHLPVVVDLLDPRRAEVMFG